MTRRACRAVLAAACILLAGRGLATGTIAGEAPTQETPSLIIQQILGAGQALRRTFGQWLTGSEPSRTLDRPYGVAWDGDDLLVTDPGARRVVRLDRKGHERAHSAAEEFSSPIGVATCAAGVVVTDSLQGTVVLLDRDLDIVRTLAKGLERPTGIACAGARIFVVETGAHRILVLDETGSIAATFGRRGLGEGDFNFPAAVAIAGESLLVGDTLNFRVQRIAAGDGSYQRSFGRLGDARGETPRIKGLAVDGMGRVWVSDSYLDQVAIFDRNGALLGDFGESGSAPGQFSFPAGIAVHRDGRIAIVDSFNQRVQILRVEGAADALPSDERSER